MKRICWLLFPVLFFGNCSQEPLIGEFSMLYVEDFEIPAGLPPLGASFFILENIQSNSAAIFAANGITPEQITEIKTSAVSLESLNPGSGNYNFLREATLLIETSELPRIDVGYRDQIFDPGTRLDMIPAITNLTEYLKSEQFNLVVQLEPDEVSQSFITTRLRVEFQVFID